jgi:carbonic anhydrase
MDKLIRGIHKFKSDVFRVNLDLFNRLVKGQHPQALFITCSDSRMVPDMICQTDPGDLFVLRNAGNLVPSYVPGQQSAEAATIEYAIRGLGIKDIIICGHTRCGAMKAALDPDPDAMKDMPRVKTWLAHAETSAQIVATQYPHLTDEARWKVMAQENVLVQLENLRTHPSVLVGLAAGTLKLHAWMYKMETGDVYAYDPEEGQYLPIRHGSEAKPVRTAGRNGTVRGPAPLEASWS